MELFNKTVGATILQVVFNCQEIGREISAKAGLTPDEMRCLMTIYLKRPTYVGDLNTLLDIAPTRTSKVLRSLERLGLIKRELDTQDKRKSHIEISEKGKDTSEKILVLANEISSKYFNLSSSDLLNQLTFLFRTNQ